MSFRAMANGIAALAEPQPRQRGEQYPPHVPIHQAVDLDFTFRLGVGDQLYIFTGRFSGT